VGKLKNGKIAIVGKVLVRKSSHAAQKFARVLTHLPSKSQLIINSARATKSIQIKRTFATFNRYFVKFFIIEVFVIF